jgi:hypothetical protein
VMLFFRTAIEKCLQMRPLPYRSSTGEMGR